MNIHVQHQITMTTQAADGFPRRSWTMDDIDAMVKAGILQEHERFELIGGEIVPMSPKGAWHETVKKDLIRYWAKALPDAIDMLTETTFRVDERNFREPDFIFWPRTIPVKDVRANDLLLLVEVSDSSLDYDLGAKAKAYAEWGVREYWVISARSLVTRIHTGPAAGGYGSQRDAPHTQRLIPTALPALAVTLADLNLMPSPAD